MSRRTVLCEEAYGILYLQTNENRNVYTQNGLILYRVLETYGNGLIIFELKTATKLGYTYWSR